MAKDDLNSEQMERLTELQNLKKSNRPKGMPKKEWQLKLAETDKEIYNLLNFSRSGITRYASSTVTFKKKMDGSSNDPFEAYTKTNPNWYG